MSARTTRRRNVPIKSVPSPVTFAAPTLDGTEDDEHPLVETEDDGIPEIDDEPEPVKGPAIESMASQVLRADFVDVNATMAGQWLGEQARNRILRKGRIVEFTRDMLAGKWEDTGEAVKFDKDGCMVDGQHRMEGLVLAAKTYPAIEVNFLIVRGLNRKAQMVMDTNTRRTAADQLRIGGFSDYAALAAAAKWCLIWDRQALYSDRLLKSVTHSEIIEYVEQNPKLKELTGLCTSKMRKHIDMPVGYVITCYYILWRMDPEYATEFFARLADGAMLPLEDPILALRHRLHELKQTRASLPGDLYMSLLMRTWNARRKGKKVSKLQVYNRDRVPIRCPMPE